MLILTGKSPGTRAGRRRPGAGFINNFPGPRRHLRRWLWPIIAVLTLVVPAISPTSPPARAVALLYQPDQVVSFSGSGNGHGVGMSQYGARGRAEQGQNATQIVQSYYQGTAVGPWATDSVRVRVMVDEDYLPPAADGSFPSSNKLPANIWGWDGQWAIEGVTGPLEPGTRMTLLTNPDRSGFQVQLFDPAGNHMLSFAFPGAMKIIALNHQTRIQVYHKFTRSVPGSNGTRFYDTYRGDIWIRQNAEGYLDTVNEVNLEDYLRGVLPAEMPSHWPFEALVAQALAARTYALTSLNPANPWWDMDDTTFYQVYEGANREDGTTNAAIDATRNQVITHGGQPIRAYYFSSSGGFTENVEDVFSENLPYLRGFRDVDASGRAFDADAPDATWSTAQFPMRVLEDMLNQKNSTRIGALHSIDLSDRSPSSRLRTVVVAGSENIRRLSAGLFQAIFNKRTPPELGLILSTRFDIQIQYPWVQPVAALDLPGGQSRYFAETSHNVIFGFKEFFDSRGGVDAFGLPLTEEFTENGLTVQYFQRAKLEYHPELAGTPYVVQLGLLGDIVTGGFDYPNDFAFPTTAEHRYFSETGQSIHFAFKKYWESEGALDAFGYPISQELFENGATVQYFQRARLEYRPELGGPFGVVRGNLGTEYLRAIGAMP